MTRRRFSREPEAVRRQELIGATLDAVAECGLAGATVREVAARAGVTQGLIRRYFVSKERLVEAAYRTFIADMTAAAEAALGKGTAAKRLARLVSASCRTPIAGSRNVAIWAAFIGALKIRPNMAAVHREEYRSYQDLLERLIDALAREQDAPLDPAALRRKAIALNALLDGLWLEISLGGDDFGDIDLVEIALDNTAALLGIPPTAFRD